MLKAARLLLSDRGQMRKVGRNAVLVVDTTQRIARVRQLFAELTPGKKTSKSLSIQTSLHDGTPVDGYAVSPFVNSGIV